MELDKAERKNSPLDAPEKHSPADPLIIAH